MMMHSLFNNSGAEFSECRQYRYILWRKWDDSKPCIQFIGLNPSTASEDQDDPTIRRVVRFAKDWGYGGVYMTNLFAIVSSDPKILLSCEDPIKDNDAYLRKAARASEEILFAWGNFSQAKERAALVAKMFPIAIALGLNKNGTPKHPLYVPADTIPQKFNSYE